MTLCYVPSLDDACSLYGIFVALGLHYLVSWKLLYLIFSSYCFVD